MTFMIREANTLDYVPLTILTKQLGYPLPENEIQRNLETICRNKNEIIYVMTDKEDVIAWIHIFHTVRLESGSFAELGGLVVDERYRGKGIGKQLLEKAAEWCRQMGIPKLKLRSNVLRKDAHRFYFRHGFRETKEQKVFELDLT